MEKKIQKENVNGVKSRKPRQEVVKKVRDMSKYKLPLFHRMILSPRSDEELETIAHDLLTWAEEEDSIVLEDFTAISGVLPQRMHEWAKRNEKLDVAMKMARKIIGARRERNALLGTHNPTVVMGMLWNYSDEYKAWKKEMKEKTPEQSTGNFRVVLEPMPNSPLVEDRE